MLVYEIFPITLPNSSLSVVFPQLPVIAIMLVLIFFLYTFETFVKNFKVFLTFICRLTSRLFWILFTIANDAFFLNDCETKLFPSFTFPLIAKKTSFFRVFFV